MVSSFISRIVILVFGTLYPAYASYKAVRTKNVKEYVKWMMYWIVFALFTCAETFTDVFLSFWFPFYYELKIITVIYLLSPATKGSSILYRKFVHPALIKKEQDIDEYIAKAKEQGYHTVLNLGSKGVSYATTLLMQTAIKSGGGLVSQLRRSYSLSDLNEEQTLRQLQQEAADATDSSYDEDPRLIRRQLFQSPRKTLSSTDKPGLYFPEIETYQRPEDDISFRQVPSYEQMSSGYSSGDPLYYNIQQPKGEQLVRTASLGPSSRVRTRAASKHGLPKRAGLSEGGSTWSSLESHESQNETDKRFSIPLSHSASLSLPFPSLQHLVTPEYQYMFGNIPQNQIFTFINHSQFSQFLNNKTVDEENKPEKLSNDCSEAVILEDSFDNSRGQTVEENYSVNLVGSVKNDDKDNAVIAQEENSVIFPKAADESDVEGETQNKSSVTMTLKNETEIKENSFQGRSGKYKKKPAPTPPAEEPMCKITKLTAEDEEAEFFTPNASPESSRKLSSSLSDLQEGKNTVDHESDVITQKTIIPEVAKKSKSKTKKTKKGDFNFQKKLHIPKMSFSFWHQKSGKDTSASETSSVASIEISTKSENKDELNYFIPLKDVDDGNEESIIKADEKC